MTQNKINHDFPADKKPWTQIAILAVNKPIQINASQKYNKKTPKWSPCLTNSDLLAIVETCFFPTPVLSPILKVN
jgi:hypothetical protein